MLRIFDIFGTPIQLKYKNFSNFSTKFSIFISFWILIILIACFVYFSQSLFQKINPKVSIIKEYHKDLSYSTKVDKEGIFMELFTFGINTEDLNQYLGITANLRDFSSNQKLNFSDCYDFYPKFYDKGFSYCIENKPIELVLNHTTGFNERSLELTISRCSNNSDTKIICKTDEEIDDYINTNTLTLGLTYWEENPFNYKEPLILVSEQYSVDIQNEYQNVFLFSFDVINVITDKGLILSNENKISNLYLNKLRTNKFRKMSSEPNAILRFQINGNVRTINRIYKKLQDVFSELGGAFLFLEIMGRFLVGLLNPVIMNISMINKIFDFYELNKKNEINHLSENNPRANYEKNFTELCINNTNTLHFKEFQIENRKQESEFVNTKNIKLEYTKQEFYDEYHNIQQRKKSNNKLEFSICDIIYSLLCPKKFLSKQRRKKKKYISKIADFMADEFDLTRIPKLSQEIKLMKYLFLTEDQRLLLNLTSNPNFYELISKKEKMNKINILTAFNIYKDSKLIKKSEVENRILECLDKETIHFFEEKLKIGINFRD